MTDNEEVQVFIGDFDVSRVRIKEPRNVSFGQGKSKITYTVSDGCYVNDDGEECDVFFELQPQSCYGVNYNFPLQASEQEKEIPKNGSVPAKANGLQVAYPLTTLSTIDSPTKNEQSIQNLFDGLWKAAVKHFQEQNKKKKNKLPPAAEGAYLMAKKKGDWKLAIKPPTSFPMKEERGQKVPDRSKPRRAYIKLLTRGTGRKLRATTPIHGPGDKNLHFTRCINKPGMIHPVMKWDGIYWGAHGRKPYIGSLRFKIAEMNYTPRSERGVPRKRMLSRNTAPVEEDESSGEEDSGFASPGGKKKSTGFKKVGEDESNPSKHLQSSDEEENDSSEEEENESDDESSEEEAPKPKVKPKMTAARRKALLKKKKAKALAAKRRRANK